MSEPERKNPTSDAKTKRRKPNKSFYAVLAVALGLIGVLLLLSVVFPNQERTRRRLEEERAAKEQELSELRLREQSLQELVALMSNRDYLIRYLREHQGYMYEGDIRIDLSDPNAVIPTPAQIVDNTVPPETEEPGEIVTETPDVNEPDTTPDA